MKRRIVFAVLYFAACFGTAAQAQTRLFGTPDTSTTSDAKTVSYTATLGAGIAADGRASTFALRAAAHYNLTERWAAGVGTGVLVYEKVLVPLFADVRYMIGRERLLTPFAEAAVGYSVTLSTDAHGGVVVNPSVGVQWRASGGVRLLLSVGWETQRFERLISRTDTYSHKEFAERLTRGAATLSLGVAF